MISKVSILARPFERALLRHLVDRVRKGNVSILARPFERALLEQIEVYRIRDVFQSSPALSSGRY